MWFRAYVVRSLFRSKNDANMTLFEMAKQAKIKQVWWHSHKFISHSVSLSGKLLARIYLVISIVTLEIKLANIDVCWNFADVHSGTLER